MTFSDLENFVSEIIERSGGEATAGTTRTVGWLDCDNRAPHERSPGPGRPAPRRGGPGSGPHHDAMGVGAELKLLRSVNLKGIRQNTLINHSQPQKTGGTQWSLPGSAHRRRTGQFSAGAHIVHGSILTKVAASLKPGEI
jgi:hypothetical protein